jgi:hypothetical protein
MREKELILVTKEARQELRELWAKRVEAFLASGLSQRAWCREHGLKQERLSYWLRKFRAEASATTYSIVESAKENGLKPFEYLKYLFTELPNAAAKDLDEFLPWSETIPDYCRTTRK